MPAPLVTLDTMTTNIPGPAPLGDKLRIAFLGPFGTFTEQAVHQVAPAAVAVKVARTLSRTLAEETLRRMIQGGQDDAD